MAESALATSPPVEEGDPSIELDNEIASIRAEIHKLTNRRHVLSSSLLSTSAIREKLQQRTSSALEPDVAPIILNSEKHAEANHHRIAFSTTSFPFKDPSPHAETPDLLGIRIDVCARGGEFVKPYYLLLRRAGKDKKSLRIYRHTIPVFIPLSELERRYLPIAPEDEHPESLKPSKVRKQDLRRLFRELRRELVAWHLRMDTVNWLREELELADGPAPDGDRSRTLLATNNQIGIVSVAPTAIEARYIRVEWEDGQFGRIKLSNRGHVERAIVIGDEGRDKATEDLFTGGDGRVENLIKRLRSANAPD
ncbi:hypothetical protein AJ80_06382 [Polytolypa hystricis UAMH7299]|uniref:Cenp-O kinetochore centromere component n=1 Tax=Polytolypa hystricis (strain UAMH7299) TaxID=1447883 RepID=A0A2B7XXC1_POLH7|nr:hypothetical protein AJ80_06382 [Polytolypa hystricis UAMH7299]